MSRYKCELCGTRVATSTTTRLCEVCLYAEQFGLARAYKQEARTLSEREARKRAKAKRG